MRKLIASLLIVSSAFAKVESVREYEVYSPSWEVVPENVEKNIPVYSLNARGGLKGIDCGTKGMAFYGLSMQLNTDALKQAIYNWKQLAYPLALYWLATTLPVVKEAVSGAEYISNQIASLTSLSCESAMNMLKDYNRSTSKIVRACVLKKLGVDVWNASSEDIKQVVESKSEAEIEKAYSECENATILDALNIPDLKKYLKSINPRRYIACNYVKELGMEDLGDRYSLKRRIIEGGDLKTYAQVLALALTPEFVIDEKTKQMILKPIEVDGKVLDERQIDSLIRESVDKEFNKLREYVKAGDYEGFKSYLHEMNSRFFIKEASLLHLFDIWFYGFKKLEAIKDKEEIAYTKGKVLLDYYVKSLKKQYETIKETNVKLEAMRMIERAQKLKKQEEKTGRFSCEN